MKKMNNKGFSLVELIVVIAILAILTGIAVPAYSGYITKANDAKVVTQLDAIKTAVFAADAEDSSTAVTTITVDKKGKITTTPALSATEQTTFKTLYGTDYGTENTALEGDLKDTSYANGVVWSTGKWTAQ